MTPSSRSRIVFISFLVCLLPLTAHAQQDTTAPTVQSFTLAPTSVNVLYAPQTITVSLRVTDDIAGFAGGVVSISAPDGQVSYYTPYFYPAQEPALDGEYQLQIRIPLYAETGTYHVEKVYLYDAVGNWHEYKEQELADAGFETRVDVVSTPDVAAPIVRDLSLSPSAVDASAGDQTVTFTLRITDDLSGVAAGIVGVLVPSGQMVYRSAYFYPKHGPSLDEEYQAQVSIPRYAEEGTYRLTMIGVNDAVGNWHSYTEAEILALGVPTTFTVASSPADAAPPVVTAFALAPATVNVKAGARTVTFTIHVTDDLAGLAGGEVCVTSPNGQVSYFSAYFYPSGGPALDGDYEARISIPQHAEDGIWHVTGVYLYDAVGHWRTYWERDLLPVASSTTFRVAYEDPPVAAAGPSRTALAGETVQLDGSASQAPDGLVVAYQWNFGDGTTGTGAQVTHTYSAAGSYVVSLTVTDDMDETAASTATVTVLTPEDGIGLLLQMIDADHLSWRQRFGLEDELHHALAALRCNGGGWWWWWWWRNYAVGELREFIGAVERQCDRGLTKAQTEELVTLAKRILAVLGGDHGDHCWR